MTADERLGCKLLAFLLEYPDANWREELALIGGIVGTLQNESMLQILEGFLEYATVAAPGEIEEPYTAAFDLSPETALNLTYHLMGDSEARGRSLAELLQIYRTVGCDPRGSELPDFLPLMLEFLAIAPQLPDSALFYACLGAVAAVAQRLKEKSHPYAGLLGLAADLTAPLIEQHSDTVKEEA